MGHSETVPFLYWTSWWQTNPHIVNLTCGAFAGMSAEAVLFPLDCFKTRVQSLSGFHGSGGFRGIYRGVGTSIAGSAPASAIFFTTYESVKHSMQGTRDVERNSGLRHVVIVAVASVLGELAACTVRVPVDLAKQRLQAGQAASFLGAVRSVRKTHSSIFRASFRATAMRDIMHSSLQYPMYEYIKSLAALWTGRRSPDCLYTWEAAVCGSVAGALSALATTPFDLLKTRLNLRTGMAAAGTSAGGLVMEEIRHIYASSGMLGFFTGATFRASWMGLGGFVFLGSFELAKERLLGRRSEVRHTKASNVSNHAPASRETAPNVAPATNAAAQRALGAEAPAFVSFSSGLIAGICVDVPLHPVDTIKTRLQARAGFMASGGFRGLWSGLSAVLLTSVPGSAMFFVIYERTRHILERHTPVALQGEAHGIWRDAAAASIADVAACVVRVPCEVMKQRMQTSQSSSVPSTLTGTIRSVNAEGFRGFFAGFGATVVREVPFALIQMSLFEELKRCHPWSQSADGDPKMQGIIGMSSGGIAGALAGMVTTPLDAAKTRIMLTERRAERRGLFPTMASIYSEAGVRGLFSGVSPRTVHCCIGGALWLGAFEASRLLIWKVVTISPL